MTIPRGVNQLDFVQKALSKGIKIQSIYTGVSLRSGKVKSTISIGKIYNKGLSWIAQYKGKQLGTFPLTEEGESAAGKRYQFYKENK